MKCIVFIANHTQVSVRLMINGTQSVNEGRVELLYNGTWGSICDDFWDYNDAVVICHMLGFATAIRAYSKYVNYIYTNM